MSKTNNKEITNEIEAIVSEMLMETNELTGKQKWTLLEIGALCGVRIEDVIEIGSKTDGYKAEARCMSGKTLPTRPNYISALSSVNSELHFYICDLIDYYMIFALFSEEDAIRCVNDMCVDMTVGYIKYVFDNRIPTIVNRTNKLGSDNTIKLINKLVPRREEAKKLLKENLFNDLTQRDEASKNVVYSISDVATMNYMSEKQIISFVKEHDINRDDQSELYVNNITNPTVSVTKVRQNTDEFVALYERLKPKIVKSLFTIEEIASILKMDIEDAKIMEKTYKHRKGSTRTSDYKPMFATLISDLLEKKELVQDTYLYSIDEIMFIHDETKESLKTFMETYGVNRKI